MAPLSNGTMPDAVSSGANNYFFSKISWVRTLQYLAVHISSYSILCACTLSYDLLHNIMLDMLYIRNFLLRSRGPGGWVRQTS